ncbi:hypothetical protein ABW20_dc0100165 [Dactylellina cionopaga]|nr:hypothetical protein ABW20_dc0100165 [Dactylellina cionopaga]
MAPKIPDIPTDVNLIGYSVLVTGGNAGIGFENARQYLQMSASPLYLAIHIYQVDLSSFDSVTSFTKKFFEEVRSLNIAVLNAGLTVLKYIPTTDGMETTFQVNYLSNAMVATYLIPLLISTATPTGKQSHLTFVSSKMQTVGSFGTKKIIPEDKNIIDWFNDKENMGLDRYNVSKLLVTAYANEIASRVDAHQVVVNSMCPGLVQSGLDNNLPVLLKYAMKFVRSVVARTSSEGARAVTLATLVDTEGNGKFYTDGIITPPASFLSTEAGRAFQKRLWDQTQERLRSLDSSIPSI